MIIKVLLEKNLAKRKKQHKENVSQIEEILHVLERHQQIEEEKIKAIKAQLKKEKDEYLLLQEQIAKSTGGAKRRKNKPLKK